MIKLHRSWPPLFKILFGNDRSRSIAFTPSVELSGHQHLHARRKRLVCAKHSAQAPEYGCFLRTEETMSDAEKGLRHRVIGLQGVCLEIQRAPSW